MGEERKMKQYIRLKDMAAYERMKDDERNKERNRRNQKYSPLMNTLNRINNNLNKALKIVS